MNLRVTTQLRADASLTTTIEATMARVRKEPGKADLRILLFQLFCLRGSWTRAVAQLDMAAQLDSTAKEMQSAYSQIIGCEIHRDNIFNGKETPSFFGQPHPWLLNLFEALRLIAHDQFAEARALRASAFAEASPSAGTVDGETFSWLADADSRLGPVLEAIIDGKYHWISFDQLRTVEIESPVDLRDLVWIPSTLSFTNGDVRVAFLPSRYPGSEHGSDDVVMAKRTEWQDLGDDTWAGTGQRMLATDAGDFSFLAVRRIEFNPAEQTHG